MNNILVYTTACVSCFITMGFQIYNSDNELSSKHTSNTSLSTEAIFSFSLLFHLF